MLASVSTMREDIWGGGMAVVRIYSRQASASPCDAMPSSACTRAEGGAVHPAKSSAQRSAELAAATDGVLTATVMRRSERPTVLGTGELSPTCVANTAL